jgi:hypothetical protein
MKLKGNVVFNGILLILFAAAFVISLNWPAKARMYPMIITAAGICFAGFLVIVGITGKDAVGNGKKASPKKAAKEKGDAEKPKVTVQSELKMIFWLALFIAIILIFGFWLAIGIYIPLFMRLYGKENWKVVGIFTAAIWFTIFITFHVGMEVSLFNGVFNIGWD